MCTIIFFGKTSVIICLYVDNMLIMDTNLEVVKNTKKFLGSKFVMKDLREADVILGIKICKIDEWLILNQSHYVKNVLKRYDHFNEKPVQTPYDSCVHLKKNREQPITQKEYAQIIRCFTYLINCTRPDIVYANPNEKH